MKVGKMRIKIKKKYKILLLKTFMSMKGFAEKENYILIFY